MSIEPLTMVAYAGVGLGGLLTGAFGTRRITGTAAHNGASEGAKSELNGTAKLVRDTHTLLQNHIATTGRNFEAVRKEFAEVRENAAETRERTARIEGLLEQSTPKTPARKRTR